VVENLQALELGEMFAVKELVEMLVEELVERLVEE
jgi:hypothetical protein